MVHRWICICNEQNIPCNGYPPIHVLRTSQTFVQRADTQANVQKKKRFTKCFSKHMGGRMKSRTQTQPRITCKHIRHIYRHFRIVVRACISIPYNAAKIKKCLEDYPDACLHNVAQMLLQEHTHRVFPTLKMHTCAPRLKPWGCHKAIQICHYTLRTCKSKKLP